MKNRFRIPDPARVRCVVIIMLAAILFVQTGCRSYKTDGAETINLLGASHVNPDEKVLARINEGDFGDKGIILNGSKGDVIDVNVSVSGPLLSGGRETAMSLELERDLWIYLYEDIVLLSLDGKHFEKLDKMLEGQLSAGISLDRETMKNTLDIDLTSYTKSR